MECTITQMIAEELRASSYINNRNPGIVKFFDKSKIWPGRQSLENCISSIFLWIDFNCAEKTQ